MLEEYKMLKVESVSFDTKNPRIKKALEKYGDKITEERICFSLRSATEESTGAPSYKRLKDSIRANRGLIMPVIVNIKNNKTVCIDGNTRLAIYKELRKEGAEGNWSEIKAIVREDASQREIEEIRVSAHLVRARDWPAYEKAKYLHYLRNEKFMDYGEMIALCGGNQKDIERRIDAYHDMDDYYREITDDSAFHIDRFSGFVELQKPGIKDAIFKAGFGLENFGEWIRDGKIHRLADVRKLPKVLQDDEAKTMFVDGAHRSIEKAIKLCERKEEQSQDPEKAIPKDATIHQLAEALAKRIGDLPRSEWRALRDREHPKAEEQIRIFEDLTEQLRDLLNDVSK